MTPLTVFLLALAIICAHAAWRTTRHDYHARRRARLRAQRALHEVQNG